VSEDDSNVYDLQGNRLAIVSMSTPITFDDVVRAIEGLSAAPVYAVAETEYLGIPVARIQPPRRLRIVKP
jgi:hypothetical protein